MRRRIAAGNWKMHGLAAGLSEIRAVMDAHPDPQCGILVCPPATLLAAAAKLAAGSPVMIGAQDCHHERSGAHTGCVSAEMIADAGGAAVILGHSERRSDHGETGELVAAKALAARAAGLLGVVCVGESEAERDAGETLAVVARQIDSSLPDGCTGESAVVAYEPVWAIGTGRSPTPAQIGEVHTSIREGLARRFGADGESIPILYGGSVKAQNAAEIFAVPGVDGALVGGASLEQGLFSPIVSALEAAPRG